MSGGLVDVNRFDGPIAETVSSSSQPANGYANLAYEHRDFFLRAWWTSWNDTNDSRINPRFDGLFQGTDRNGIIPLSLNANTYDVEAQHSLELASVNRITYGVNYRLNTASSNYLSGFTQENRFGLFLEDEWKFNPSLRAVAGARYDLDSFIKPTISPRFTLLYSPIPSHAFHFGISVGYRPPTIFETHLQGLGVVTLPPPLPSPPPTLALGSTNLSPEKMVSYDLGYQGWYLRHRVRLRADLFFNHITNLITIRTQTPPTIAIESNDPGIADIYGGEAGLEFLATKSLTGFTNFSSLLI